MSKREALRLAREILGFRVYAQGSEEGTGYANRCYLMRRVVTKSIAYQAVGIGRTWGEAVRNATQGKEKEAEV